MVYRLDELKGGGVRSFIYAHGWQKRKFGIDCESDAKCIQHRCISLKKSIDVKMYDKISLSLYMILEFPFSLKRLEQNLSFTMLTLL